MKKIILLSLIAVCNLTFAQITFQKTYSGGFGYCVHQTSDGGYILIGTIYPQVPGNTIDINLIKTNEYGDTLWTKTFGMSDHDFAYSGQETSDGGYIILANFEIPFATVLIKTNSFGDTLWTKRYAANFGKVVQQTSDGGYIITGFNQLASGQNDDSYLLKTDSLGEILWEKTYGYYNKDEVGECLKQTIDNGFILAGTTVGGGTGVSKNIWILKTDSVGDTLWTREIGAAGIDEASSIIQTFDGNFLLAGYTDNGGSSPNSTFLLQLDSIGDSLWARSYSNGDYPGTSVQQTSDSGFIITGSTQSLTAQHADVFLIKTNSSGDTLWTRFFGGSDYEHAYSLKQTSDGGFIISGTTQSFATTGTNTYLIKTDFEGHSGCNENNFITIPGSFSFSYLKDTIVVALQEDSVVATTSIVGNGGTATTLCSAVNIRDEIGVTDAGIIIYPNPAMGAINIYSTLPSSEIKINKIEIFNMIGEMVFMKPIEFQSQQKSELNVDVSFLNSGIYIVQLSGEGVYRSRIVLE